MATRRAHPSRPAARATATAAGGTAVAAAGASRIESLDPRAYGYVRRMLTGQVRPAMLVDAIDIAERLVVEKVTAKGWATAFDPTSRAQVVSARILADGTATGTCSRCVGTAICAHVVGALIATSDMQWEAAGKPAVGEAGREAPPSDPFDTKRPMTAAAFAAWAAAENVAPVATLPLRDLLSLREAASMALPLATMTAVDALASDGAAYKHLTERTREVIAMMARRTLTIVKARDAELARLMALPMATGVAHGDRAVQTLREELQQRHTALGWRPGSDATVEAARLDVRGNLRLTYLPNTPCPRGATSALLEHGNTALRVSCGCTADSCDAVYNATAFVLRAVAGDGMDEALRAPVLAFLRTAAWERRIGQLVGLARAGKAAESVQPTEVGWKLELHKNTLVPVGVTVRTSKKTGEIAYSLRDLTREQRAAVQQGWARAGLVRRLAALDLSGMMRRLGTSYWGRITGREHRAVLDAVIGEPYVFVGSSRLPWTLLRERPTVDVRRQTDTGEVSVCVTLGGVSLGDEHLYAFSNDAYGDGGGGALAVVIDEERRTLWYGEVDEQGRDIIGALRGALRVPEEAMPSIAQFLGELGDSTSMHVDDGLCGDSLTGDPSTIVLLQRGATAATGRLTISLGVRPIAGAAVRMPGAGSEQFFWEHEGQLRLVDRLLGEEQGAADEFVAVTPLASIPPTESYRWSLGDAQLDDALATVRIAEETGHELVWVDGPAIRVGLLDTNALTLQVSSGRDWFGATGAADATGASVPLGELLEAIRQRRTHVRVNDDAWVTLSPQLREALRPLAHLASGGAKDRLSLLHAPLIEAVEAEGARVDAPAKWRSMPQRVREAASLKVSVPKALKARLRPYQKTGFAWLARTAHWSTGAILADDMGLGKTVQAIALLLHRLKHGPVLVVCPTSVAFNWERELATFAPSLTSRIYPGRDAAVGEDALADGQITIVSYDLLALYSERFKATKWGTIVVDEAQAFKNPQTKRARAVFDLQGEFVLALTGTPIENRSFEAWSLFRAIAPGYLGTLDHFRDRFAVPIEVRGDREVRATLAALMRPLILRRRKREVATDLPDRIESRVEVELSPKEREIYDRVRQASIEHVRNPPPGMNALQARILALAALTRLRQIACHARLVDEAAPAVSAKQTAVLELLAELKEEGRRALVFSQFTSLLDLVEAAATEAGITSLRLDGSTPAAQRKTLVDRFQDGDADAFFLSLKAGGTGLNLTAADTVIHLDPWWNPAAEDQATDRAHRIGQTRSVTVIRIVALGTVEAGILDIHASKRELVEALLDGTSDASVISLDELVRLMASGDEAT